MRFKPLIDKLFWILFIPTMAFMLIMTVVAAFQPLMLLLMLPVDLLVLYFFISPLFGYVELKEKSVFIKYGFIMKKEIDYSKIRGLTRERKFYSNSMMCLKNAFDHIDIKYNAFDVTTVSVISNDTLYRALNIKCFDRQV